MPCLMASLPTGPWASSTKPRDREGGGEGWEREEMAEGGNADGQREAEEAASVK